MKTNYKTVIYAVACMLLCSNSANGIQATHRSFINIKQGHRHNHHINARQHQLVHISDEEDDETEDDDENMEEEEFDDNDTGKKGGKVNLIVSDFEADRLA